MPKSTQKRPSMSNVLDTETAKDASSQVKRSDSSKSTKSNKDFVGEKVAKDKANECIKSCIGDDEPSTEQDCVTNESFSKSIAGDKLLSSTAKRSDSEENVNETPLKKDDAYNTLNIRKKSLANIKESAKEVGSVSSDDNHLYVDLNKNINYTKLLTDQILYLDSQVVEHCKTNTDLSGSTAVVAVLDGELLVVGNVGDSRAVMADDRGRAIPLSFDHKPNQLKERRRIKEAGGFITFTGVWRVAGILATSRALGDFPLKHPRPLVTAEPDILTFSLNDHKAQFVILATDGLWDVLSNEDAVSYVRARLHEPDFGAKSVAQYAYALGSQDNITVAIINFTKMNKNNTTPR
uniref:Protein phosphatase 1L-like n=2 Tax=Hirondellea gigas TaxID=1518452 RepID=A0A6A7FSB8_9CRUS